MFYRGQNSKQVPLKVAGSSTFGRYPKISQARTYNMFISGDPTSKEEWLVPYAGYESILENLGLSGRAIYTSNISNQMVAVVDNKVYALEGVYNPLLTNPYSFVATQVGTIDTFVTYVSIAENNVGQIAICDSENLYIYTPFGSPVFQQIPNDTIAPDLFENLIPLYINFHNTRFMLAIQTSSPSNHWILSAENNGTIWPADAAHTSGSIQTKPDRTVAITRFPSRGNMIFVFGENVVEAWFDTGGQLFPYQRNQSFNIDYGLLSPATLAATDEMVVWLAQNEKSGPIIMASNGGPPEKITDDGIDHLLSNISNPYDSEAFIYRQDGHLFYHINFYTDNFSLFYDFNTKKFYHASDETMNYFIASDLAFFNNQYYFVSRNDGKVYAFDTTYTTYDGLEIPRVRICDPIRLPTQDFFLVNDIGFTTEQGTTDPYYQENGSGELVFSYPRIDMSFSTNGGESFGNTVPYQTNPLGLRKNKALWWRLGYMNDCQVKFRFVGFGRFMAMNGIATLRI